MLGLSLSLANCRTGGTPAPAPAPTVFASDDFANPTTVTLTGWTPDIGANWVQNAAAATTGRIVGGSGYVDGTSGSGHYSVIPTTPDSADYEVRGGINDFNSASLPGLLVRFSNSAATGYRVFRNSDNTLVFQRLVAGAATTLKAAAYPVPGTTTHVWRFAVYTLSDRVRLRLVNETTGWVQVVDDTSGSRITATNYGGIGYRTGSRIFAPFTIQSLLTPSTHTTITADGTRTWYNYPVVLADGALMYAGSVKSDGSVQVTKTDGSTHTTTVLSSALQVDDHNEASLLKLPGGKLMCTYSKHSADNFLRYRVSSNALPDTSAFATEVTISDTATSYTLPFLLSDNVVRIFYRTGSGAQRDRKVAKAPAADVEAGTASWTLSTVFQTTSQRPYMSACQGASDRIHFLVSNGHPNEVATSVYHCKMQLSGGTDVYSDSAGNAITLPVNAATEATLIDDKTGGRCWNDKIIEGSDGHPRVLYYKYPSSTGARDVMFTDIEYWHARWTGSAWVKNRLLTGQVSLYPNENHYAGGMCFDGNDPTILYLSEIVNGVYEIRKYQFNESTGGKTLLQQITSNSQSHNLRPQSPVGGSRPYAVTWLHGPYITYTDYGTEMRAA